MTVLPEILDLKRRMNLEIVGQDKIVETIIIGILANGNLLVEGLPGLAKTRAIKALSNNIEGEFSRIQFTPDITSPDITGREVFYAAEADGKGTFKFIPGPIFSNIVLADELNRAPPRSQNALLEAMEERQVTVAGVTHKVPRLFMVMATMNPAGQQGTYALPEAQMDRFLMHISVHYPDEEAEGNIIRLVRGEQSQDKAKQEKPKEERVLTPQETIFKARGELDKIIVPPDVERYLVDLVFATRYPQRYTYQLKSYIEMGVSPRGSIAFDKVIRAHAWLHGRTTAEISDVKALVKSVFRHRIMRSERAKEHSITTDDIVDDILCLVPCPSETSADSPPDPNQVG